MFLKAALYLSCGIFILAHCPVPCVFIEQFVSPSLKPLAPTFTLALSVCEICSGLSGHLGKPRASSKWMNEKNKILLLVVVMRWESKRGTYVKQHCQTWGGLFGAPEMGLCPCGAWWRSWCLRSGVVHSNQPQNVRGGWRQIEVVEGCNSVSDKDTHWTSLFFQMMGMNNSWRWDLYIPFNLLYFGAHHVNYYEPYYSFPSRSGVDKLRPTSQIQLAKSLSKCTFIGI